MELYVCDACKKNEPRKPSYNLPPDGWYTVSQYGSGKPTQHLCSSVCLARFAQDEKGQVIAEATANEERMQA